MGCISCDNCKSKHLHKNNREAIFLQIWRHFVGSGGCGGGRGIKHEDILHEELQTMHNVVAVGTYLGAKFLSGKVSAHTRFQSDPPSSTSSRTSTLEINTRRCLGPTMPKFLEKIFAKK